MKEQGEKIMDPNKQRSVLTDESNLSLVRGGPTFQFLQAMGLVRGEEWNLGRMLIFAFAIGWLPIPIITLLTNPRALWSFFADYRMHARLLLAVPALLLGFKLMEGRLGLILRHMRSAQLLTPEDLS